MKAMWAIKFPHTITSPNNILANGAYQCIIIIIRRNTFGTGGAGISSGTGSAGNAAGSAGNAAGSAGNAAGAAGNGAGAAGCAGNAAGLQAVQANGGGGGGGAAFETAAGAAGSAAGDAIEGRPFEAGDATEAIDIRTAEGGA